jgi:SAM-dependent methyltransferase
MTSAAFRDLRLAELENSVGLLRHFGVESGDLLEIGAGTGWQSKALSDLGYRVKAIDLPAHCEISNHARSREWPIINYDGVHIPFPDDSFDVIYSSNVLEHVVELDLLTNEMRRVLRPGGVALHLIPNPQWRMISLLTYYPAQAVDAVRYLRRRLRRSTGPTGAATTEHKPGSFFSKVAKRLAPPTHGSVGTPITELRRFSKASWDSYFERHGWEVIHYSNNGIFASGEYLLGSILRISMRRRIGIMLGGIAHVYLARMRDGA